MSAVKLKRIWVLGFKFKNLAIRNLNRQVEMQRQTSIKLTVKTEDGKHK